MGLFKKIAGVFGAGDSRPIAQLENKKELSDILKRQMSSAQNADISRQEGKLAGEQALAGTTSAIRSQKGLSSGLKQRQIAGEGRKLQGQIAGSQMLAGLKERQQGLRDAAATASGSQAAAAAREGAISKADQDKKARRMNFQLS